MRLGQGLWPWPGHFAFYLLQNSRIMFHDQIVLWSKRYTSDEGGVSGVVSQMEETDEVVDMARDHSRLRMYSAFNSQRFSTAE